nr:hypothetical protein [Tanacetum cinerariifolium]
MRFITKHETVQKYDAIFLDTLTNQAIKESDVYKTYYDFATRKVIPKPKYVRRSTREKIDQAPKSSPDDDKEQTESNNVGDDFVHPKLSTFNEEERYEGKLDEEEDGDNVEEGKLDEEKKNEEEEVNELYNDVNINLEGRDTKITDALSANVQATQVIEYTHVIMIAVTPEVQQKSSSISSGFISTMLNPNPDTGIDSILNLNIDSTSLVDVPVTTNDEIPSLIVTTLPLPPSPLIHHVQQTLVFSPTIDPSSSL